MNQTRIALKRILTILLLSLSSQAILALPIDSVRFAGFGTVVVYHPQKVESVALFVSGDGGWNKGVVALAKAFVGMNALVVGIDDRVYTRYLNKQKRACVYPAADFEQLSLFIQRKYGLKQYQKPVLIGYSSGATLVYGMLVQAPANTFRGGIALGFCPDIELNKTLCAGNGLQSHPLKAGQSYYLEAVRQIPAPLVMVTGQIDKVCNCEATRAFIKDTKNALFIGLPGVGHGFLKQASWLPQVEKAYRQLLMPARPAPGVLPQGVSLTVTPVRQKTAGPMALLISGDGGWTSFDQSLAQTLATQGIPSVGLDAQRYFWTARTPAATTAQVSKIIDYYATLWGKPGFVLVGYSFGADVMPFIANRLPAGLRHDLQGVVMLSPDPDADFEIHVLDMLNLGRSNAYNVVKEVKNSRGIPMLCLFGSDEESANRVPFRTAGATTVVVPGGHHYNNNFPLIVNTIRQYLADTHKLSSPKP